MGRKSSIPYQIGTTGFMVNRKAYKGDISSLSVLFDPPAELKGKINVLDSQGEVMALAAMYMGIPQCSTDRDQLKKLNAQLQKSKESWASFGSDIAKDVLVSGDATVGMIYNGFGAKARSENADLEYALSQGRICILDGQRGAAQKRTEPGQCHQVHELPSRAGKCCCGLPIMRSTFQASQGADKYFIDDVKNAPELNPPAGQKGAFIEACSPGSPEGL